jgi:iron complex transport system substrate-binding protein
VRRPSPLPVLLLLASLAVFGAGCEQSGFDERKETVMPLKVQHGLGETKVPGRAKEPLSLTIDTLDDTLALGVRPARAAVPGARLPAYLRREGRGVPLMRPVTSADLAALEAVHADLILGSASGQGRLYDALSPIAPTVMTEGGGGQWKLNVRLVGEALGRANETEQVLIDYDRVAAGTQRAIAAAATGSAKPRVAVARLTADGLRYAKRDSFAGTILADAGVKQVTRDEPDARVDLMLLSEAPGAKGLAGGRSTPVDDPLWWGPGGLLAARAALAELQAALGG